MVELLKNRDNCTGCTACYNICNKNAITMVSDQLGFLYPSINPERCVDCGLCLKVCPKDKPLAYSIDNKTVLYGISQKNDTVMTSSSGGAFSELVIAVERIHPNFHCYAAVFVDGEVRHKCISSSSELFKQKKSKYTQSHLSDTFRSIKTDLASDVFVIFVGTPCQVDGLNNYLCQRAYSNLLTIDLLCTGACSPQLLKNHVHYLESRHKAKVVTYDMRKKEYINGSWHIMNVDIVYDNGIRESQEDKYFIGCFRQHVAFRESCYNCKYTTSARPADITLGDYWKEDPNFSFGGYKGISVIMGNTLHGKEWSSLLQNTMSLKQTTIDDIRYQQPALRNPVTRPSFHIGKDISSITGSIRFMKSYYRGPLKIRLLEKLSQAMPVGIADRLKKVYYGFKK